MTLADYLVLTPEIGLVILAALILAVDMYFKPKKEGTLAWLTFAGLAVIFVGTIAVWLTSPVEHGLVWGNMLRYDALAFTFRLVFLFGAAATVLLTMKHDSLWQRGEFYVLLVLSTLGMTLMGAAADLVMLFLAIETASIPLYVMAGFMQDDEKSNEAGFKYLLFGALTSSIMAYGFSLFYGFAGTTNLYEMAAAISAGDISAITLVGAVLLSLAGFGFKVAAVPFHFWAPDVYEGAPTPVTAFLSTASKAAGFSVLLRFMLVVLPSDAISVRSWTLVIALLATFSMTFGNLIAMKQTNIKRLLAYSSIAHAGYMLMGVAAASDFGVQSVLYYVVVYMVTNLAAFGMIIIVSRVIGSDEIADYAGISRRHPGLGFGMLLAMLSLAGIPPLGGFIAKTLVFAAAVKSGLVWLAIIGILNAIVGLYYYLIIIKVVWLDRNEETEGQPLPVLRSHGLAVVMTLVAMLALGIIFTPLFDWSAIAAAVLF